jgi:hypothetical protein
MNGFTSFSPVQDVLAIKQEILTTPSCSATTTTTSASTSSSVYQGALIQEQIPKPSHTAFPLPPDFPPTQRPTPLKRFPSSSRRQ